MIQRKLTDDVIKRLNEVPAVVLLGARQTGKTTLAHAVADGTDALYLDLESPRDRALLDEPELFLEGQDRLVILDEVHRVPEIFPVLRGLIDRNRRSGKKAGMYLLLGSASLELLKQSGDSLAGRVSYQKLSGLSILETGSAEETETALWVRGGFPDSFLARDGGQSLRWREDFILTYLEREIPRFGGTLDSSILRRLWTMLAHNQGGLQNSAGIAAGLGIDVRTVNTYLGLMEGLFLLRRLQPWHGNIRKRLVKSPKIYLRDSGIVHTLLGISDRETLLGHPVAGPSWEGFIMEQVFSVLPHGADAFFYRTSAGAELDLLLVFPGGEKWAVEIKRSVKPKPSRGFHSACDDVRADRQFVIYPGRHSFSPAEGVEAMPPADFLEILSR